MSISIDFISAFQYYVSSITSVINNVFRFVELLISWGVIAPLFE